MSDAVVQDLGLRERKRLATRRAIALAALRLVREHGLEAATIDEISRAADISPRTFFNYFASKEDAVLGDAPTLPAAGDIETFLSDAAVPLREALANLFVAFAELASIDLEFIELRRQLAHDNPRLTVLHKEAFREFENELGRAIARRAAVLGAWPGASRDVHERRGLLIAGAATAALRLAWREWAAGRGELGFCIRAAFDDIGPACELLAGE